MPLEPTVILLGVLLLLVGVAIGLIAMLLGRLTKLPSAQQDELSLTESRLNARLNDLLQLHNSLNSQQREELQLSMRTRFEEGFKVVEKHLSEVRIGLNQVDRLSGSVDQFNALLGNVKTRGTWGEVQLGAILGDILAPSQFEQNVHPNPHAPKSVVEYAIKLPGGDTGPVYLPIDSKFPREDYERLLQAHQLNDESLIDTYTKRLFVRLSTDASAIRTRYLAPPYTTDFGILFLPTEGLYAEVARHGKWLEEIQRKYRILVASPMTLSALINALQVGFKTLAIQQKSSEVWQLLTKVKNDLTLYHSELDKIEKNINQSLSAVQSASNRLAILSRKINALEDFAAATDGVPNHA